MSLSEIQDAREAVDAGNAKLHSLARKAIKDEVDKLLNLPDIESVSWSQKSSEYNDEGMHPGVFGPVINRDLDSGYNRVLYGYDDTNDDWRLIDLRNILKGIGDDILSNIFGDETFVDASLDSFGNIRFDTEWMGY